MINNFSYKLLRDANLCLLKSEAISEINNPVELEKKISLLSMVVSKVIDCLDDMEKKGRSPITLAMVRELIRTVLKEENLR